MKRKLIQAVIVALFSASTAFAAPVLKLQPRSQLFVEGKSTVRDFTCQAKELESRIDLADELEAVTVEQIASKVKDVKLTIPAKALDCSNDTMNEHMQKALDASAYQNISVEIRKYELGAVGEGGIAPLKLYADITMKGQTRPVTINAVAKPSSDGTVHVEGRYSLRMTDWGVQPPTLMLGTMKVRESVVIRFEVALGR